MFDTCKQEKTQVTSGRDEKGRFRKGVSGNPKGNTHTKDLDRLIQALDDRSKRGGYQDFDALVADRALQYETVLIAVMKKVYPEPSIQTFNIYTQIWNGAIAKSAKVDQFGRLINT